MTKTAVYRIYDSQDVLLYVGIAGDFGKRWLQHASAKPWWGEVRRQTVTWYDSRQEAREIELTAIRTENPQYNIADKSERRSRAHAVPAEGQADYDKIVKQCGRAVHSLWHDGCSREQTLQLARGRYGRAVGLRPEHELAAEAEKAVRDNWQRIRTCPECQAGRARAAVTGWRHGQVVEASPGPGPWWPRLEAE